MDMNTFTGFQDNTSSLVQVQLLTHKFIDSNKSIDKFTKQ